jgi:hypothetical protein
MDDAIATENSEQTCATLAQLLWPGGTDAEYTSREESHILSVVRRR